jgi:hypothetical protein
MADVRTRYEKEPAMGKKKEGGNHHIVYQEHPSKVEWFEDSSCRKCLSLDELDSVL